MIFLCICKYAFSITVIRHNFLKLKFYFRSLNSANIFVLLNSGCISVHKKRESHTLLLLQTCLFALRVILIFCLSSNMIFYIDIFYSLHYGQLHDG
jgi:hypothetical protein